MKINLKFIKLITGFALSAILILQGLWLISMYQSYLTEYSQTVDRCLLEAIDIELTMRHFTQKESIKYWFNPDDKDTSSVVSKTIVTEDTILHIRVNRYEPHAMSKVMQYHMKYIRPIDVNKLDSIFHQLLLHNRFPVKDTYIEYLDLEKNDVLNSSNKHSGKRFYKSDIFSVDILDSIGVRAYVNTPFFVILERMLFQLLLSAILIVTAAFCLFRLLSTLFQQNRLETFRRDFVNSMTHEFQRPINSAILKISMANDLLAINDIESVKGFLSDSSIDLKKLDLYTKKIQEISQGEEGAVEVNKSKLELMPFLENLITKYKQNGPKNVVLTLQADKEWVIYTDMLHFSNIMENLVENSIKYSGDTVEITIRVVRKKKNIEIAVRDNGFGISEKEIGQVFNKFYRGKSRIKREKKGFGLGLSYVKTMVGALGGSIYVDSEEGKYTEFVLLFPNEEN